MKQLNLLVLCVCMSVTLIVGSYAQFFESEPNDTRFEANHFVMDHGQWLEGTSIGSTGSEVDYFRVQTVGMTPSVYRYRLILTSETPGHVGEIRGQGQIAAPAGPWPGPVGTGAGNEGFIQRSNTATDPPRFVQWYGFGYQESIYFRVNGTSSTGLPYRATLDRLEITPTDLGSFQPGTITISTIGGTSVNTEIWVYDANFNPIPGYGNDDESVDGGGTGATTQSLLVRDYTPGVYYLALSRFQLTNGLGSPCDDDFRTGAMLYPENGNAVLSSPTTTITPIGFTFTDSAGTQSFTSASFGPYEIQWYRYEVVPEPASCVALAAGLTGLLRLRRRWGITTQ